MQQGQESWLNPFLFVLAGAAGQHGDKATASHVQH